ncbi:uncharacterized protein LOC120668694 isoform X2 [Panicum virgatum]|uniref:Uncharacterized protein n=1 Tax=Panicum virgatum TaxID=38727 RepID=A0A8T0T8J8_PANVG|nr:uncharacterized protein LOC120668694 isoform X2 [Panicum virgatum]KAG2605575.1 hypothetical protein PVAP13_4NG096900 [Panicum virgatum]
MRATAASVLFNWIQRRVQPLQKRENFGFQYQGSEDSSLLSAEQMERTSGLRIIRSIFPDQLSVSYVPTVFRANNPRSQADVGVFKSGPLIPDYTQAKNQRNIYMPVDVNIDEPIIEEDPISSSDESPNSPSREGRDKRVLVPSGAPRSADETSTGYGPECKWL